MNARDNNIGVDRHGWTLVIAGATPDSNRDVLAWHSADQWPVPAFYDEEENCWFSKYDGRLLGDGEITHWREIEAPEGVPV